MGGSYERYLVNRLYAHQFAVMRAPSSGSASQHELPDVIALKAEGAPGHNYHGPQRRWALEAKTNGRHHIYVNADEISALNAFCNRGGLTPYIAARWKQDHDAGWNSHNDHWDATARYLIPPSECYRTDDGSYRVTRPDKRNDPDRPWNGPVITDEEVR